jgi:hypothetical protein
MTIGDNWCDIDIQQGHMTSVLMRVNHVNKNVTFSTWN